jgi:hypothetical protein
MKRYGGKEWMKRLKKGMEHRSEDDDAVDKQPSEP